MKTITSAGLWCAMGLMAVSVVMGICGVGCDTVDSSNDVITFDPPALSISNGEDVVVMVIDTNATLFLPLQWSVSEPIGLILPQGPLTAIYRPQPVTGVNTIEVFDQGNAQGTVIVYQEAP